MSVIGKSKGWPTFTPECDSCHQPKDALVSMLLMSEEMGHHRYEVFICKECLENALAELAKTVAANERGDYSDVNYIVLGPD